MWRCCIVLILSSLVFGHAELLRHITEFKAAPQHHFYVEETSIVFLQLENFEVWRSGDYGASWDRLNVGDKPTPFRHEFDQKRVYFLGSNLAHKKTSDGGQTLTDFVTPLPPVQTVPALTFHMSQPNTLLFVGRKCDRNSACHNQAFISRDEGGTWTLLETYVERCLFAARPEFSTADLNTTIYCSAHPRRSDSGEPDASVLLYRSNDAFKSSSVLGSTGIRDFSIFGRFLAAVQQTQQSSTLLVSVDGISLRASRYPDNLASRELTYTVLESTPSSLFVDVSASASYERLAGTMLSSSSDGTQFSIVLQKTSRHGWIVDFERVQSTKEILLANILTNPVEASMGAPKRRRTLISFDNGAEWFPIPAPPLDVNGNRIDCPGDCSLHLHNVASRRPINYLYSAESAPGLLVAVGNTGEFLSDYEDARTYVSRDAGLTWQEVRQGPYLHKIGDSGSLLVLADDRQPTDTLRYSLNEGQSWNDFKFSEQPCRVKSISNDPRGLSKHFLLFGRKSGAGARTPFVVIHVDMSRTSEPCRTSDFEEWTVRKRTDFADLCFMGQRTAYERRRAGSTCSIGRRVVPPPRISAVCECKEWDFECDLNFERNAEDKCVRTAGSPVPDTCRYGEKYSAPSGYRKIPGNQCRDGTQLDRPTELDCPRNPNEKTCTEGVDVRMFSFKDVIQQVLYSGSILIARDSHGRALRSIDVGITWTELASATEVQTMVQSQSDPKRIMFLSSQTSHLFTPDGGETLIPFQTPLPPAESSASFVFHANEPESFLFIGTTNCLVESDCKNVAFVTTDRGRTWNQIETYALMCLWGRTASLASRPDTVYCAAQSSKSGRQAPPGAANIELVRGTNYYRSDRRVLAQRVQGFHIVQRFLVVAARSDNATSPMVLSVSSDGETLVPARFYTPPTVVLKEMAYTILASSPGSIFIDVLTQDASPFRPFGTLFSSNSEGNDFKQLLEFTNRNEIGFVDFGKMPGLDGILLANVVQNPAAVRRGDDKQLQTRVSFDNGNTWRPLRAPASSVANDTYDCQPPSCSLHLHGVTQLRRANLASLGAPVGLMVGVGNIGERLGSYRDGNTYLSRDGGLTWTEVRRGPHLFEFAGRGAILLLVPDADRTRTVSYSFDDGRTWCEGQIPIGPDEAVTVDAVTSEPNSASRVFVLFARKPSRTGTPTHVALHIDFAPLLTRRCVDADLEMFRPSEVHHVSCMFGRNVTYYRRRADARCYMDQTKEPKIDVEHCECTREDFECEYDHRLDNGVCKRIGPEPPIPSACPTGWYVVPAAYRRIPISQCRGGVQLDHPEERRCGTSTGLFSFFLVALLMGGLAGFLYVRPDIRDALLHEGRRGYDAARQHYYRYRGGYSAVPTDGPELENLVEDYE